MQKITLILIMLVLLAFPVRSAAAQGEGLAPDIASYDIQVRLDVEQRLLEGQEIITYVNTTQEPIPDLVFHLYLNAFRDENSLFLSESSLQHRGKVFDPESNGWVEVDAVSLLDGTGLELELLEDGTLARAELPQPVAPGERVQVVMSFRSKLPLVFARTGWALDAQGDPFFMVGQWFPKLGVWEEEGWNAYPFYSNAEFYADFGTYDVAITLPESYETAASGMPVSSQPADEGMKTVTYRAEDVIDFAWAASPNFQTTSRQVGNVELLYVYLPEHEWTVERVLDAGEAALVHFGEWYGPYPYQRLTVMDTPDEGQGAGGMEYPTLVTAGTMSLLGLGPELGQAGIERSLELVTIHEIGHQWWQSMVAFNEVEEPWLDEGFTDYSAVRLARELYGDESAITAGGVEVSYLDLRRMEYQISPQVPMYGKAWEFDSLQYGVASYSKPALSLLTLEGVLGEETMLEIMSTFFERYRFSHPSTEDFRQVAAEVNGEDVAWFFDGLVYGGDTVNYRLTGIDEHSFTVQRSGELAVPVEILVTFEDGETMMVPWDGAETERTFTYPDRIVHIAEIDPERKILIDLVWSDNGLARQVNSASWLALLGRITYWLQDLLLAMGGL